MRPILLQGHERALTQIKYNRDGDIIFSTAKDQHICAWYAHNGERLGSYHGHQGALWTVDVDPTSTLLASGAADNTVRLWDVKTGKCLKTWDFNTAVKRVEFSEDGSQLLAVTEKRMGFLGTIVVMDITLDVNAEQSDEKSLTITCEDSKATVAGWSFLSKYIIAGHEDGTSGEQLDNVQVHEADAMVTDLQWAPDRTYFITSSKDKTAKIVDATNLQVMKTFVADTPLNSASITPKKDFVILGGGQAAMDVTTTSTRQGKFEARFYHKVFEEEIGRVRGHFGPLNTVAVDPNGKGYASGGEDGYTAAIVAARRACEHSLDGLDRPEGWREVTWNKYWIKQQLYSVKPVTLLGALVVRGTKPGEEEDRRDEREEVGDISNLYRLPAAAPGAPATSGCTRRVTSITSIRPTSITPPHHPSHHPQPVAVAPSLPPSALRAAAPLRTGLGFITARTILPILPRAASLRYSSPSSTPPLSRNLSFTTSNPTRRLFSSSSVDMAGIKIDGNAIAKDIREKLHAQIDEQLKTNPRFHPSLKIIQVGDRSDSSTYVKMKLKAAEEAGISCELIHFPESTTEGELIDQIDVLNNDPTVHGILVQLPVPKHISEYSVTSSVANEKDVDGFGAINIGELAKRGGVPLFTPCTPKGVMKLLESTGVDLKGKKAVVLGRSDIVGSPVSYLLKDADATVTVCHSATQNIESYVKEADVLVSAIGKAHFVKGEWIKPGAIVIDVGTNFIPDETKKSGQRLVGDVDYSAAVEVASHITPVPGGVGPMTVAMLLQNVVDAATSSFARERARRILPLPLKLRTPVPSDIAISRAQHPKQITRVAAEVGVLGGELEPYGAYKAKVDLSLLKRLEHRRNGRYVVVTGITPTPLGEGKSTTTMGVTQALGAHLGRIAFANVRQPSQGPTFGIKGGAAGGGYSQVIPMDEFNLHLTGDIHAVTAANNLLAAAIETRMFHENTQKDGGLYKRLVPVKKGKREFQPIWHRRLKKLGIDKTNPDDLTPEEITRFARLDIDPATITWRRVLDVNDRHLRGITVGTAATERGQTRETGFDISVASECMAILALSNSLADMRERLGRMVIGTSKSGEPVTADDLGAGGALAALMKDAIKPNLMQTLEGTPVFVHAGPFANISIGASSVLADKLALKLAGTEADEDHNAKAGFVITEAGFDFTMGGERFFNIKCRSSGLVPDVVVIVATVRALKVHGGGPPIAPGGALDKVYTEENVDILRKGCVNLKKHIENAKQYGVPVVVAINKFETDTEAEVQVIREEAIAAGAEDAIPANHWAEGGAGAVDLAKGVIAASEKEKDFKLLYTTEGTVQERMEAICKKMYGADKVEFSELAQQKVDTYTKQGFGNLPICIAKTQYSLSHDPELKGAPTGFTVPIRDVRLAVGAGYLYALAADIQTIPGLPTAPGYINVDIDTETGEIDGLF
ncbi:hypothetical protein V498_05925 [Pseudogymnoascus sp. VKM F-4517 (FW-2822)]|nr:hypothetical protein V498_05925 [Pseudogymnoascus sp. VKM F-4517 (FW-2822)]